ncbi:MAG TPA: hypothetical protein VJ723_02355, partial [Candidatus Angelobacter sp.]|nr:hypothetical protein [Candidatus Angelobacter sp.]
IPEAIQLPDLSKRHPMDEFTKMQLVQLFNAEMVRIRKTLPVGNRNITISPDGVVRPGDARLHQLAENYGATGKIGDLVKITTFVFKERAVYLELNGGPKHHSKWYEHISISAAGGTTAPPEDPNQAAPAGTAITLDFDRPVPQMTAAELRQLLSPVFDFGLKSAAQVAAEALPPQIQEAVKNHEILVGMNRDMVILVKDRPLQRIREKDEKGLEHEDWIYGEPPEEVVFVRIVGDEVVQVKSAKPGGDIVVKTQKEIDVKDGVATLVSAKLGITVPDTAQHSAQEQQQPARKPTLRREGEAPEVPKPVSGQTRQRKEEPEWGTDGQKPPSPPPPQSPPPLRFWVAD